MTGRRFPESTGEQVNVCSPVGDARAHPPNLKAQESSIFMEDLKGRKRGFTRGTGERVHLFTRISRRPNKTFRSKQTIRGQHD